MDNINQIKRSKLIWIALMFISWIGIIIMISLTYSTNNSGIRSAAENNLWKERLIMPFYFTFLSNVFGVITSSSIVYLTIFKKVKFTVDRLSFMKILMVVSLTVTLMVYWTLLGPSSIPKQDTPHIISNVIVHLLTPIMAVLAFMYEVICFGGRKLEYKNTTLKIFIFPVVWIIVAVIMYYALGGEKDDAIYSFLRFGQNSWWSSIIYLLGIGIVFCAITTMFIWFNNKNSLNTNGRV